MRSKTIMKMLTMFLTFSLLTGGSAMTAFAYGNGEESTEKTESFAESETVTVSDDSGSWKSDDAGDKEPEDRDDGALTKDDESLDVEWNIVEKKDPNGDGILTPVGNLTLVDDLSEEEAENLQYMTVKTKSGNIFYLIVDRSGDEDNVYFLNTVDESDLMALMDEETQEKFREATAPGNKVESAEVSTDTVLFTNQDKEKLTDDSLDKSEKDKKQTGNNPIVMLLIFGVIGAGVAGGYYFFKIKPEKEQPAVDEDMEFYDDEDYVNEDTVNEDQDDESGGDDTSEAESTGSDEDDYRPGVDDFSDESIDD
ncbi:MAG: DUF4366 domain-containing protein [Oribacterium sp.]|nr:DUF4366 domain-containing protein [Oribacterium sp.]